MSWEGKSKLLPHQFALLSGAVWSGARVLEIGTYHGVTAARLADTHPGASIVSLDTFGHLGPADGPACWMANHRHNQFLFIGTAQDFARVCYGMRFDVILVDGDHQYRPCRADLATALALLAPGGRLFAHDYGKAPGWKWPGVTRAVDEFCAEHGLRVVANAGSLVEIGP